MALEDHLVAHEHYIRAPVRSNPLRKACTLWSSSEPSIGRKDGRQPKTEDTITYDILVVGGLQVLAEAALKEAAFSSEAPEIVVRALPSLEEEVLTLRRGLCVRLS